MTKQYIISLIVCGIIIITSCNFSKGAKTDFNTGLSFNYNGFGVQDVLLIGAGNKAVNSNKVKLNTHVAVAATGITNYELKDGKVFPGMMLIVTDKHGSPVVSSADLFAGGGGYLPINATELRGDITIATPMVAGETYHVKIHIWDKIKPEDQINAEADLVVI